LSDSKGLILFTGGTGFIGSNLADGLLADGHEVIVLDNLRRLGAALNLDWLASRHGARLRPVIAHLRDGPAVRATVADAAVVHLAAQAAVTTSLSGPVDDFEVNTRHPRRAGGGVSDGAAAAGDLRLQGSTARSRTRAWTRAGAATCPAIRACVRGASARTAR